MKTIVLDDDPTGTQSATGATVFLALSPSTLGADVREALAAADSVYVQTNSRALPEADAVELAQQIRRAGAEASSALGEPVRFVLRGDSTLRGHVFPETDVFLQDASVMLFVPAFPAGGRTTRNGMHYVRVGPEDLPAHETEYADDPVFGFSTGYLPDYVAEAAARPTVDVPLRDLRAGRLESTLREAPPGSVVLPDAVDDEDIALIAAATDAAMAAGTKVVVRSGSPLAAHLAGVASTGLLDLPVATGQGRTLLVCGSHTAGATAQLDRVAEVIGAPEYIGTTEALEDPRAAGRQAAAKAATSDGDVLFVSTERTRSAEHNTLQHGERVMTALVTAVEALLPQVDAVITKGGITSAEVIRSSIGARTAIVLGQVLPGVSAWSLRDRTDRELVCIVVPGNVGDAGTLVAALSSVGAGS